MDPTAENARTPDPRPARSNSSRRHRQSNRRRRRRRIIAAIAITATAGLLISVISFAARALWTFRAPLLVVVNTVTDPVVAGTYLHELGAINPNATTIRAVVIMICGPIDLTDVDPEEWWQEKSQQCSLLKKDEILGGEHSSLRFRSTASRVEVKAWGNDHRGVVISGNYRDLPTWTLVLFALVLGTK